MIFDAGRYRLTFASDGEEALGLALLEPPRLVITELILDRLDGVSLGEQLKGHLSTNGVKVLVLTTSTAEWDQRRAWRAGVDGYITKPFSPAQLLQQAEELLEDEGYEPGRSRRMARDQGDCS